VVPIHGGDGPTLSGPFLVYTTSNSVRSSCDGVGSITSLARGMTGLGTMAGGISTAVVSDKGWGLSMARET